MTKVCAFMSLFNEEDVIEETVAKMIANDVDIFVLDNGCTDGTISKIQKYVGKGIVDIYPFTTEEDGKKVFRLYDILEQFEIFSRQLGYDWYLISDADEIKYSPWEGYSLKEGIARVSSAGFNLINFKLYNFRPVDENVDVQAIEKSLTYYARPDQASAIQMKCWKKSDALDLKSFGGHLISVPNPLLFPLRFINKHYPIRNRAHAIKKIKEERMERYSPSELKRGWHSHYSKIHSDPSLHLLWSSDELTPFDLTFERSVLFEEALDASLPVTKYLASYSDDDFKNEILRNISSRQLASDLHVQQVFEVAKNIYDLSTHYELPPIEVAKDDFPLIKLIHELFRFKDGCSGNLLKVNRSQKINLEVKN